MSRRPALSVSQALSETCKHNVYASLNLRHTTAEAWRPAYWGLQSPLGDLHGSGGVFSWAYEQQRLKHLRRLPEGML